MDGLKCVGVKVKNVPRVGGKGVFATASRAKGELIMRYAGETITVREGSEREDAKEKVKTLHMYP